MRCIVLSLIALAFVDGPLRAQDAVKPLLQKLDSKDADVRFDALMQLAALGPKAGPAIDRLASILTRFDEKERALAIVALGRIGKPAIPAIEKLLTHEDELTRHDAVWTLGLMGTKAEACVPRLLKLVQLDSDAEVRVKAVFALSRIDPSEPTMKALVKIMTDDEAPFVVRIAVVKQLPDWGESAIPPLGEALRKPATDFFAERALAALLAKHKTRSAAEAMRPFIVEAYAKADARRSVYYPHKASAPIAYLDSSLCDGEGMSFVLATVGAQLIGPLEKQLHGKNAQARIQACKSLAQMGRTLAMHKDAPGMVEEIVKLLVPFLQHDDRDTREALAVNMPYTKTSAAALVEAQIDFDPKVSYAARLTLMAYGVDDALPRAFARLHLTKGPEQIRIAAALLYSDPSLKIMRDALCGKDADLRHQAAYLVGSRHGFIGQKPEEIRKLVVPVLIESLQSNDPTIRLQAAEGLAQSALQLDAAQVRIVIAAVADKDVKVRFHALSALGLNSFDHPKMVLPAVVPFLSDPVVATRVAAVACFGNSRAPGLPELLKAFEKEGELAVRHAMIEALAQQVADPRAYQALLTAAEGGGDPMSALLRVAEKKSVLKVLAILARNDEAVRLTLAELPKSPTTMAAAAKALAPLLQRDDLAANRRALHTLEQFLPLLRQTETSNWLDETQRALAKRMPQLKKNLQSKDIVERRETVELLAEIASLHEAVAPSWGRGMFALGDSVPPLYLPAEHALDELLGIARRDVELAIRRVARKTARSAFPAIR